MARLQHVPGRRACATHATLNLHAEVLYLLHALSRVLARFSIPGMQTTTL